MKFLSALTLLGLVAAEETCYLPIDVMFLQDTTGSFVDDLPNVVSQIPNMVAEILAQNPESWFGVAEFKDKPYFPLGEPNDFCYKLDGKLQGDVDVFKADYSRLYASGGGDLPEAQFQALIDISLDPAVGWRPIVTGSRSSDHSGARLVIMSTDAEPHVPGDVAKMHPLYPDVPADLPASPGTLNPPTIEAACNNYEYASGYQAQAALASENIYLAILTPNEDAKVVGAWKWVNEDLLGQPADFYQFISSDSSDLIDGVLAAIKAVTDYACAQTTTTSTTVEMTTVEITTVPETTVELTTVEETTIPFSSVSESTSTTTLPTPPSPTASMTESMTESTTEENTPATEECPPCEPCPPEENECPPCPPHPCAQRAAVVIKVDHRPGKLEVYYEK